VNNHFKYVCQYGVTHGQCRCPSQFKSTRPIICNKPTHHQPKKDNENGN